MNSLEKSAFQRGQEFQGNLDASQLSRLRMINEVRRKDLLSGSIKDEVEGAVYHALTCDDPNLSGKLFKKAGVSYQQPEWKQFLHGLQTPAKG